MLISYVRLDHTLHWINYGIQINISSIYFINCRGLGEREGQKTLTLDVISLKGWMWMAKGSFSLLSSPLVAGTAFIVLQNTL